MDKDTLKQEATKWHDWFQKGQKNWSFAHHTTVFGSIGCSVLAGALLQVKSSDVVGFAAVLTSIAAALTSLATAGAFERKWRSNQLSRSRVDCLLIDLQAESPNLPVLATKLKDIIAKHDLEIITEESKEKGKKDNVKSDSEKNGDAYRPKTDKQSRCAYNTPDGNSLAFHSS